MARALKTSNIAYEHLIGTVPFIAHEGCKEKSHGNACDYRRPTAEAATDFPNVDFALVVPTDPLLPNLEEETDATQSDRAYGFMQWLMARPEREIVVSSHSAWLFNVLNTVRLPIAPSSSLVDFPHPQLGVKVPPILSPPKGAHLRRPVLSSSQPTPPRPPPGQIYDSLC